MRNEIQLLGLLFLFTASCSSLKTSNSTSSSSKSSSIRSNDAIAQMLDRERDAELSNVPTGRSLS